MKRFAVLMVLLLIGVLAVSAAPKFKIGMVFDLAGRGDNSFNDSAYNGLVAIAKGYKGWIQDDPSKVNFGTEVQLKYLEPKAGGQDREILLRALAEDGYQLIYGIGFLFSDALAKVAKDFPNTQFGLIDGYIPDLTDSSNITCLSFKENEGSFLVGAIAALKAKGKSIGFLGGMDIPLIHRFENGFDAGAMYVSKVYRANGMIMGQYIGKDPTAFNDPTNGYNISSNFYKQGAAIVFHAAGGSGDGLFKAAQESKKMAIGVDSDQGVIYAIGEGSGDQGPRAVHPHLDDEEGGHRGVPERQGLHRQQREARRRLPLLRPEGERRRLRGEPVQQGEPRRRAGEDPPAPRGHHQREDHGPG